MGNKQKFFSQLQNLYVGAKLDGKGGMANLLQFKCQYFERIKPLIETEIKKNFPDSGDTNLPELYEKLYTFFSSYLTDGGSIYFSDTPAYKNVYAKVYFDKEDTALFYKTKDLYYVKSQIMYQSVENLTFNHENKSIGLYFDFDATNYIPTNNNTKEKVLILFTGVKNQKFQFKVIEQSQIINQATDASDEQLKGVAEVTLYSIKKSNTQLFEESSSFYAINFNQNDKCRKSVLNFSAINGIETTEEIINKAINIYKKQNEVDFFIHKNAKGFLTEQFNLFIYNYLSNDIDSLLEQSRLDNIRKIKAIVFKVIDYISKFEDELKAIWDKPKFVRNYNYVVTLDKLLDKGLNISILTNHAGIVAQIKEWQDLGMVKEDFNLDKITMSQDMFVDSKYKYLPFDTKHFTDIKYQILSLFDNLDEECDGVLIKSDNYQALNTLKTKYNDKVKCIYIDPPYNTKNNEFIYNDGYKSSTWLSMMENRLIEARDKLADDGVIFISIDENEISQIKLLANSAFGVENFAGEIIWKNSSKNDQSYITIQHEYILSYVKDKTKNIGNWLELKDGLPEIYKAFDSFKKKHGNNWEEIHKEALAFYKGFPPSNPIFDSKHYTWMDEKGVYFPDNISGPNYGQYVYDVRHPITNEICKAPASGWRYTEDRLKQRIKDNLIHFGKDHTVIPNNKTYLKNTEYQSLTSIKYIDGRVASSLLEGMFNNKIFKNPKDINLLNQIFKAVVISNNELILDFFAGSGTTGHAVINLNREDGGQRKYMLVEMGSHFDNIVLPRIKKVIYTDNWKDGKAQDNNGISQLVKYYELEQYEDVLDKAVYKANIGSNLAYDFSNNEKLAHDGLAIDYSNESNPIHYSFETLYPDVDIWETISNFYGYKIKQYHSSNQVTYTTRDGREITLSKDKITFDNMPELKALIWW